MPYRALTSDEINSMFAESTKYTEREWSARLGGDVYARGVRAGGNENHSHTQTFTNTIYWLHGETETFSKRSELMEHYDEAHDNAAGPEHVRRAWTPEEDKQLRKYKETVHVGWADCKETAEGFELGTGALLLGRTKSAVEKHWRNIKDDVPSLDDAATDDSDDAEGSAPTSPCPPPGLLVFLGDSNCLSLATGSHEETTHMEVWSNKFGVAGKIPAVNGGVNRSVYGFDGGSVNVHTYLHDAKKVVPKKYGNGIRDALAALKNKPRGLVFWGFKNHIEGSRGSDRFRASIEHYCNLLIEDVRKYSKFTADSSFPIYLVGLFQPKQEQAVNAVNEAIENVAQKKGDNVHYIDLAEHLEPEHASSADALHLTPEGYAEAAKAIAFTVRLVEQKLRRAGAGASAEAGSSAGATTPPSQKDLEKDLAEGRTQGQEAEASIKSIRQEKHALNAPSPQDVANLTSQMESLKSQLREVMAAHKAATVKRSRWDDLDRQEQAQMSKLRKIQEHQEKLEDAARAREEEAKARKAYLAAIAEANACKAAMRDD